MSKPNPTADQDEAQSRLLDPTRGMSGGRQADF